MIKTIFIDGRLYVLESTDAEKDWDVIFNWYEKINF